MPPKMTTHMRDGGDELRLAAQHRLQKPHGPAVARRGKSPARTTGPADVEAQRTELATQNQHLREARLQLQHALERFRDLYDLAPVGYLTLDSSGMILE